MSLLKWLGTRQRIHQMLIYWLLPPPRGKHTIFQVISFSVFEKVPKIDNSKVETATDFCLFVAIPA